MRSLLDSSLLIALLDQDHNFHPEARSWFKSSLTDGWATCPITENAAVRILSNPNYSSAATFSPADICELLLSLINATNHESWPCDLSILDSSTFSYKHILGPKQITDVYLLGLAVHHGGRLVTYDQRITVDAVPEATLQDLIVL